MSASLLQGGGSGEPADRQPHGPEQPLHPGGSREQLLSPRRGPESTEGVSVSGLRGGKHPFFGQFGGGGGCWPTAGRRGNARPYNQQPHARRDRYYLELLLGRFLPLRLPDAFIQRNCRLKSAINLQESVTGDGRHGPVTFRNHQGF